MAGLSAARARGRVGGSGGQMRAGSISFGREGTRSNSFKIYTDSQESIT